MFGARQQMSQSKWKSPPGKIYRQDQLKRKIDFNFPSIDIKQLNACFENAGGGLWHKHAQKISCYGFTQVCPHKISYCPLLPLGFFKEMAENKKCPSLHSHLFDNGLVYKCWCTTYCMTVQIEHGCCSSLLKALNYAINAQKAIFCHNAKIFFFISN